MATENQEHRRYEADQKRETRETYSTRNPLKALLRYVQVNLGLTPEARNAIRRAARQERRKT